MTVSNWMRYFLSVPLRLLTLDILGTHTRMRHPIIFLSLSIHLLVSFFFTPLSGSNSFVFIAFHAYRRRMGMR